MDGLRRRSGFVPLRRTRPDQQVQRESACRSRGFIPPATNHSYLFNPIVVDNVMYVLARNSSLVALDAATGKEIWIHANLPGLTTRGIAYWESKDRKDRRLIFSDQRLSRRDRRPHRQIDLEVRKHGLVNLREGLGRDPKTISPHSIRHSGARLRGPDYVGIRHRRGVSCRLPAIFAPIT